MLPDDTYADYERITQIEQSLDEIRIDLSFIREHIVKSSEVIEKVAKEVMPTVDALTKSPMLKMLLPKAKS